MPLAAERPILIVEDDVALSETLIDQLTNNGEFAAIAATSIRRSYNHAGRTRCGRCNRPEDVGLPDGDGRDLCAQLRKEGHQMPIIMLTGSNDDADVVRGLDAGRE